MLKISVYFFTWFILPSLRSSGSIESTTFPQDKYYSNHNSNRPDYRRLSVWLSNKGGVKIPRIGESSASNFNYSRWPRRGLGHFFIYHFEKKDREQEKREEQLTQEHNTRQQQISAHSDRI